MSRFGRKTDGILEGAEGRFMTQIGHSACLRFQPKGDFQRLPMIVWILPHADQQQRVRSVLGQRAEPVHGELLPAGFLTARGAAAEGRPSDADWTCRR